MQILEIPEVAGQFPRAVGVGDKYFHVCIKIFIEAMPGANCGATDTGPVSFARSEPGRTSDNSLPIAGGPPGRNKTPFLPCSYDASR